MKTDRRKFIIRSANQQDLADLNDTNNYYHYPELIEIKGSKYIVGSGASDNVKIFSNDKNVTYILTTNYGLNYASLDKINHEFKELYELVMVQNVDNIEGLTKDFFDYSINSQCDILRNMCEC